MFPHEKETVTEAWNHCQISRCALLLLRVPTVDGAERTTKRRESHRGMQRFEATNALNALIQWSVNGGCLCRCKGTFPLSIPCTQWIFLGV